MSRSDDEHKYIRYTVERRANKVHHKHSSALVCKKCRTWKESCPRCKSKKVYCHNCSVCTYCVPHTDYEEPVLDTLPYGWTVVDRNKESESGIESNDLIQLI